MSNPEEPKLAADTQHVSDAQADPLVEQREKNMHRAMITDELAIAFGGSALATVGVEHNVRGFVAAAALGAVALIVARSAHDIKRAYRTDNPSDGQV